MVRLGEMQKNFWKAMVLGLLLHSTLTQRTSKHRDGGLLESGYKCKTCKRVVMSLQTFLKKEKAHAKIGVQGMGMLEESLQSEFEKLCTYSNVFFDKTFRKSCEALIGEYEDLMILSVIKHVKSGYKINLVDGLCHGVAKYCPAGCNSTESEVSATKEKYMSERPPTDEKGPLRTIVAATWMEMVINTNQDVLVFQYQEESAMRRRLSRLLTEVAEVLQPCPSVAVGQIGLARNEIPPPYGEHVADDSISLWRNGHKMQPVAVAEPARLETAYDAVDFVFNALPRDSESFACLFNVSARLPRDTLRRLQRPREDL